MVLIVQLDIFQNRCVLCYIVSLFHSYLVMPYMFTDLSKVRGPLSEDKVQFLIYQTLCGLRVSPGVLL